ncbi:MAG: pyrroline-5-carboxylate reductase [Mesorhizobium sp.]|uniref:pyrroline-5-carboxylate reductase n=1 Tax=Mesorhizobium sp. TaxID=1871066 RepID=UPI000FE44037|nr:pyrroline-5-carboxylate reductase [Mesorhizobium sp.]RWA70943.1 MAG: pyrroline-5-carboxylate reductase [Mesorhizobium sp.]RWG81655.1 MAG: pyrroline-5-carboxylate reductase [Mesorhizobium sp.]RWK08197.1 MAG: pyrroline-5-carboxylate reductase [Mesorhizobium sp.]RWK08236.1 MAG: pyrroline-5-carboxylate reductase [Mesorhizobium sp.]RWK16831.1 MAG: pyrroline-5-carboxylate reductase [Mesorhizobium sp.]
MKLGFVGTGAITESVVRGLVKAGNDLEGIAVSPRNADVAARLAALHQLIRVARDNQSVVDSSDIVFLAVRPQVANDIVAGLEFHPGQRVVSFVAGLQLEELAEWTRGIPRLCRAIPVPLVADLHGVTAIFPGDSVVTELFSSLGSVVEARDAAEFELFGAACCLMGTYFGFLDVIARWMMAKGMLNEHARDFLAHLFAGLSETARASPERSFEELRTAYSTKGSLNEQVFDLFISYGGGAAVTGGLEAAFSRLAPSLERTRDRGHGPVSSG